MTQVRNDAGRLRTRLLTWFDRKRRPMPWRDEPTPYRVWISEIMLQQTRVATVLPYFERFLERFPDLDALATASEEEVLAAWSGLGYYRRARNLLRAARIVVREMGGHLPGSTAALRALPGVGDYTAGAVASIAFERPEPALDGNGVRVLTRLDAAGGDPARQPLKGELWGRLAELVAGPRPGDVNQALMELGARVCLPRAPSCGACPVAVGCRARIAGEPEAFPQSPRREEPVELRVEVGVFRRGEELLLARGERPFLRGLWNLPYRVLDGAGAFPPERWGELGLRLRRTRRLGERRHTITRYRIRQELLAADVELMVADRRPEYRWAGTAERERLGLPAFSLRVLSKLEL